MSEREKSFNRKSKLGSFSKDLLANKKSTKDYLKEIATLEITGSYEIGDIIASGGLKDVRKVKDQNTGRYVAMAQLKAEHLKDDELKNSIINVERFIREAKTLASLEHANIVPIYEINYKDDIGLFFTMKLLSGETLHSILKNLKMKNPEYERNFPTRKLLETFIQICDAIIYAHTKDIVHLDIKPSNIQISEFGEVTVIDWGMSKQINTDHEADYEIQDLDSIPGSKDVHLTQTGTITGTPGFMSPEQADNNIGIPAKASDIYSLGATLYSIIYQRSPYSNLNADNIIENTRKGIGPDFSEPSKRNVPPALKAIIEKAMMHEPDERYTSVTDLRDDIMLYMNDFITHAEDIKLLSFTKLFIKRHQNAVLASMITLLLFLSYFIYSENRLQEREAYFIKQNIKLNATASEIISGTLKKHHELKRQKEYDKILLNYEKLAALGHNYAAFWYDIAKVHAGKLNYKECYSYLSKISGSKSDIKQEERFTFMLSAAKHAYEISKQRSLSVRNISNFALNMDPETQFHVYWTLNTDSSTSIEEKIKNLQLSLSHWNNNLPLNQINCKYSLKNGRAILDLSNNPRIIRLIPIRGLDIDELYVNNTQYKYSHITDNLRRGIKTLDISETSSNISAGWLTGLEKLIAQRAAFIACDIQQCKNLVHLDIEGANVGCAQIQASDTLQFLNIAHTKFSNLDFLRNFPALNELIIDDQMVISKQTMNILKSRGTTIRVR